MRIIQQKNGQFMITIPKNLAIAFDMKKGEDYEFKINKNGRMELVKQG